MDAARSGDRQALDDLLRRHYDRLYAVCRRLTGNDADAADATQDALISIVRGLPRFDGTNARFSTWAYRVAVNATLDELRRRKRRTAGSLDEAIGMGVPSSESRVADRIDIDAALEKLPMEFRTAVVLRDLCGLDYAEISSVLDIPGGTVRSRISRGRSMLLGLLGNPSKSDDRPTPTP